MCQMKANTTLSQMKYEPDEVGPGSSGFEISTNYQRYMVVVVVEV